MRPTLDPLEAELATPAGLTVESHRWWPGSSFLLLTVGCPCGNTVLGVLPAGTRRAEHRAMIRHLRRRHAGTHGCGCAGKPAATGPYE